MATVRNVAKERLEAGELAIGVGLRQARAVEIAKAMKTAGFDFLFIDMEHNAMSIETAAEISVAAQDAGIAPIVRVAGFEHYLATRALDAGAQGIVVPHVDTPDAAAQMARNCKYPPIGRRSITGALPQLDFETVPAAEAMAAINDSTLLIVMLESAEAIDNAERIAAVPGVDGLLVGCNDLCIELGIPGRLDDPKLLAALERTVGACRAHGKHPGLGGVYQPPLIERYVELGFRLILGGSDLSFLMAAARERAAAIRAMHPG
ncbi:MAG: HpcH/HpaI aldolase family protein [Geminicoccaceae bacterium]